MATMFLGARSFNGNISSWPLTVKSMITMLLDESFDHIYPVGTHLK